ncbi:MAG: DUF3996 domain-containing protein [Spirochaetales bacterium]|nr:DUF3996 domain-containing protein [Spirochaetales bacterium]
MLRYTWLVLLLLCLFAGCPLYADMAIGIIVGEPTGISFKYDNFPVLGVAWSFENYFHVHADFWLLNPVLSDPVTWFLGVGAKAKFYFDETRQREENSEFALGVRVPVGVQYFFETRYELFLEVAPGIELFPATEFDIDFGIGFRYHF